MNISSMYSIGFVGLMTIYSLSSVLSTAVSMAKCNNLEKEAVQYIVKPVSTETLRLEKELEKCRK